MRILIIGKLKGQIGEAVKVIANRGVKVVTALDIVSALKTLRDGNSFELILLDVDEDLKTYFKSIEEERFSLTTIACGVDVSKQQATEAIKLGAKDFLPLPPDEDLIAAIFDSIANYDQEDKIIYKSDGYNSVLKMCEQVAPSDASILITGESGTGKEVIAKFIHQHSKRKDRYLVSVNCAAIPENLLESELFGHEKGSFTGAIERRIGKFEEANGSTILLDEITEMDLKLQSKLLRVLQEREVTRVGGNNTIKLDLRIIATSNRDILQEVKKGNFREDLYFRLNVINVILPALRDRNEDIKPLSEYFLHKYAKLNGMKHKPLNDEAFEKLISHTWPGNIRELENTIHRALLIAPENIILKESILLTPTTFGNDNQDNETLDEMERKAIKKALEKSKGDEIKAAMVLGISIKTLKSKIKEFQRASSF